MSDYANRIRDRQSFLALKVRSGTATPEECAEYERTKGVRMVTTTSGPTIIEPERITSEQWNEYVKRRNQQLRERWPDDHTQ